MKEKNKGITLIALIITIIIMLILVAVSISLALNSGLFEKAGKATQDWQTAQDAEGELGAGKVNIGGKWYASIDDYLNNKPISTIKINLSMVHTETPVTADGTKIKEIKEGAPIPVDFYYVGGTKNTGVVISDNSNDENKGDGHNVELEGNQFVWVPVLQNQKLKIEVTSEKEITGIKIEDPLFSEITTDKDGNTLAPSGTSYAVEINPTINGTYTVTVNTAEETNSKTLKVSSLYAQDFNCDIKEQYTEEYAKANGYDSLQDMLDDWFDVGTTVEQAIQEDIDWFSDYSDSTIATYSNSVNTYGGFYIARYEAGCDTARTTSGATLGTVYSKKNMYPYNYVTQTQAISQSSGMYTKSNITVALINAAAWDRTLNWLVETNAITTSEMSIDSKSWGNYHDSTFNFTGKCSTSNGSSYTDVTNSIPKPVDTSYLLGTGVSDYTKRNNIYDLAGNCWEWPTEVHSSGYVVFRGGDYGTYSSDSPAGCRDGSDLNLSRSFISFRPSLYIK